MKIFIWKYLHDLDIEIKKEDLNLSIDYSDIDEFCRSLHAISTDIYFKCDKIPEKKPHHIDNSKEFISTPFVEHKSLTISKATSEEDFVLQYNIENGVRLKIPEKLMTHFIDCILLTKNLGYYGDVVMNGQFFSNEKLVVNRIIFWSAKKGDIIYY